MNTDSFMSYKIVNSIKRIYGREKEEKAVRMREFIICLRVR